MVDTKALHDFFTPQPIVDASIFMIRAVFHDWPTSYPKRILMQLRPVAQPTTKTLIVERIVSYTTKAELPSSTQNITGRDKPERPFPLIPGAGSFDYSMDLHVRAASLMEFTGVCNRDQHRCSICAAA